MSESVDRMLIQVERDLDRKQIERAKINLVSLIKKCTPENLDELFRALEILEEIERGEGVYFGKNAEKFAAYIRNLAVCKPDSWNMVDLFDARVAILRARSLAKNPDKSHEFAIEATGLVEDLMSASEIFQSEENWDEALQAEFCASVMKLRVAEIFGASMEFCFANLCEIVGFCKFCDSQIEYKIGYLTEKLDEVDEDFFILKAITMRLMNSLIVLCFNEKISKFLNFNFVRFNQLWRRSVECASLRRWRPRFYWVILILTILMVIEKSRDS